MRILKSTDLEKDFFEYAEFNEVKIVKDILRDVKANGDAALKRYTKRFDGLDLEAIEVSRKEIQDAYDGSDKELIAAIKQAAKNIRLFAKEQFRQFKDFEITIEGNILGQKIIPLQRAGCYVPGGRYPLISTALMCIIPAKVAGVSEVLVCSPKIAPATIVAADIAGADRIFRIGGAQAVAAMAYGTETVPAVDKIVGPGNQFVTAAKKQVFGRVGIDLLAGPSELLVVSDDTGNPSFIAADLLAQAEHDPNAGCTLLTTSRELAEKVNQQVEAQLAELRSREIAEQALSKGRIILVNDLAEAIDISNRKAPEHVELFLKEPAQIMSKLTNYGSLFIGEYSAEVFGDYCSGANHTLPTNGAAKYTGGLSVKDFLKIVTYQENSREGSQKLIKTASKLAETEGLDAHRKAAEIRKE